MSRATKFENLHFKNIYFGKYEKDKEDEEATPLYMIQMKKGEIYELNNGDHYYIGCTKNTSQERFKEHLSKKDDPIHKIEGNWTCKKLIDVYFKDEEELLLIEGKYISMYAKQNKLLVNTQKVPGDEIKYKIVGPHIDERIKVKFSIEEHNGFFLLKKKEENQKITTKKVRYGKRKTIEQARQEILNIKEDLKKELNPEFTIIFD
jgi:hypothetical protein